MGLLSRSNFSLSISSTAYHGLAFAFTEMQPPFSGATVHLRLPSHRFLRLFRNRITPAFASSPTEFVVGRRRSPFTSSWLHWLHSDIGLTVAAAPALLATAILVLEWTWHWALDEHMLFRMIVVALLSVVHETFGPSQGCTLLRVVATMRILLPLLLTRSIPVRPTPYTIVPLRWPVWLGLPLPVGLYRPYL